MMTRSLHLFGVLIFVCLGIVACTSAGTKLDSGLWHFKAGLYRQAIPLLLSGTPDIERADPSDPRLPTAYVALGDMAVADKENQRAEEFYNKALKAAKTKHSQDPVLNRNALVHAGNFLRSQGRFTEALPLLTDATTISGREASMPRLLHANDLDNLSLAYSGMQDQVKADATSQRALEVLGGLEQSADVKASKGIVLYNAAYRMAEQGHDSEADAYYRESLALVSAYGEQWRKNVVLSNYATFLRKVGRHSEAATLDGQIKK